jgi:hypothetical protein
MRTKFILRLGAVSFAGFILLSVIAGVLLAEGTLHPGRRPLSPEHEMQARAMARGHDAQFADVAITAADGVILRAWSLSQDTGTGVRSFCFTVSATTAWG